MNGWESTKFKIHAVMTVPGAGAKGADITFNFDVIQYSHEFELNGIPSCTLSIPLGRRADMTGTADGVSEIHRAINVLKVQVPVTVFCRARTLAGTGVTARWPVTEFGGQPKTFVIFRGNASSGAMSKAFGNVRYVLTITHWLADMAYSSALSQSTHPTTPNSFFFPASFGLQDLSSGSLLPAEPGAWTGVGLAMKYFLPNTLTSDFWGGPNPGGQGNTGMKQWFTALSSQDRLNPAQIKADLSTLGLAGCQFDAAAKNTDALRALENFEPKAYVNGAPPFYRLGVPLRLDPHGANMAIVSKNIGEEVGLESLLGYTNTTLWDKLAGQFHANYLFSVVPTVDTAIVVPFIPGLRGPYHRLIKTDEYESCEVYDNQPRALRAVAAIMGRTWSVGAAIGNEDSKEPPPTYEGIGGWFGTCKPGMVLFKQSPLWLTSVSPAFYSGDSVPAFGPINTAIGPQGGQAPSTPAPSRVFKDAQQIWNAYAQSLYVYEVLKHRQGTLSGRVRFDIAPGSLVRIQNSEDKFTWNLIGQKDYMYAYAVVLRVSTSIDAETCKASTAFTLAHVRTEAENADPATSICRHPLWNAIWSGCSLVDDEAFSPVATSITSQPLIQLACGQWPDIPPLF